MMLGSSCSPCCGCSADEYYAIWQRLLASSCSVDVQADNKQQHGATCIQPGFANGGSGIINKFFPPQEEAYSAQRFFYRPTPEFSGTHQLAVDLTQSSTGTYWSDGVGVVKWTYSTIDMSLTVLAYVGTVPYQAYLPSQSSGGSGNTVLVSWMQNPITLSGRCPVYYTISAVFKRYSFYTRVAQYDPYQFSLTQYAGAIPSDAGGGSFTTNLASAGAPVAHAFSLGNGLDNTFYLGESPSASAYIGTSMWMLQAWWQQYSLTLTDQQIRDALTPATASTIMGGGFGNEGITLASLREIICLPSDGTSASSDTVSTGTMRIPYQTKPWQWVDNSDPKWMSSPSFSGFWNYFWGALMSVQGSQSLYRYEQVSDSNFSTSFSITVTDE